MNSCFQLFGELFVLSNDCGVAGVERLDFIGECFNLLLMLKNRLLLQPQLQPHPHELLLLHLDLLPLLCPRLTQRGELLSRHLLNLIRVLEIPVGDLRDLLRGFLLLVDE